MNQNELRKVQLVQLEIAEEVARVCDENGIKYFLDYGTLLGAVRHEGFIPWDDDLDIGMLREDYEKFCKIAPEKLNEKYYFQTWNTDSGYAIPFGKVRKEGTLYVEGKANELKKNGIYVDVFPYDDSPEDVEESKKLKKSLVQIERVILMKCKYKPWDEDGKINWKKRIGYCFYQLKALFATEEEWKIRYEAVAKPTSKSNIVYCQDGLPVHRMIPKEWFKNLEKTLFEGKAFNVPVKRHEYLTMVYGDYMQLPPVEQRENRHQIVKLDFGE